MQSNKTIQPGHQAIFQSWDGMNSSAFEATPSRLQHDTVDKQIHNARALQLMTESSVPLLDVKQLRIERRRFRKDNRLTPRWLD